MAETNILSGKVVSDAVYAALEDRIKTLSDNHSTVPGLAAVIVGDDPASQVYVNSKKKAFEKYGCESETFHLSSDSDQQEIIDLINKLNENDEIHGILIQLPLPKTFDSKKILLEKFKNML